MHLFGAPYYLSNLFFNSLVDFHVHHNILIIRDILFLILRDILFVSSYYVRNLFFIRLMDSLLLSFSTAEVWEDGRGSQEWSLELQ